ncbi:5-carboxymethyl-2-hydroxymuconate Delta-isomerase [Ornithinibacillus bavariensis]|uniref:5-carboxymethyl-2-hydroxymuconate isomerase n=1 Tax=Ornithinibacillus bavariensis TaxID=545502 RepID=A0A920C582_9BACI|nr:5-carboxymethyl-2-hydroxymuconate Delta-isomerase [Ornithinibacillus bavariensis]GIO26531.1 5-carboxymethyl-2-hydroxymuconate isomerase [Ornithinibacillus bavariensis]HAM80189.1 5-carboxymethyl-2-hydroxymuconate isomerase [Ornithinibacillus sp.]
MPHVTVEYTDNLRDDGDIKGLLLKINETLIAEGDAFPIGGIRSRAIELKDYVIADGTGGNDDAFVHVTLKIGSGRPNEVKMAACDSLFRVLEEHFEKHFAERNIAISLELFEFMYPTYKKNNIHRRYQ